MDGFEDKYGVTFRDVLDLIAGRVSESKRRRLAKAVCDPDHPLSFLARQSGNGQPFLAEWPPQDLPADIAKLLDGDMEATNTDDAIRRLVDAAIEPYLQGSEPLIDLENRAIVDAVCQKLTDHADSQLLLRVASSLESALNDFLAGDTHAVDVTDTVTAGLNTTFASSAVHADLARKRHDAINTFRDIDIEQCSTYMLHEFAGRTIDEISALMNLSASDVRQRLAIARAEINALLES